MAACQAKIFGRAFNWWNNKGVEASPNELVFSHTGAEVDVELVGRGRYNNGLGEIVVSSRVAEQDALKEIGKILTMNPVTPLLGLRLDNNANSFKISGT